MPTPAYLAGVLLFSLLGFAAWRFGKRAEHLPTRLLGLALMLFPYAVPGTGALYAVGVALCAAIWFVNR
jgi:tellurite resistance protein TehA-like permease